MLNFIILVHDISFRSSNKKGMAHKMRVHNLQAPPQNYHWPPCFPGIVKHLPLE